MLCRFLLNLNPLNLYTCLSQVNRFEPSGEGGSLDNLANLSHSATTWTPHSSIWGVGLVTKCELDTSLQGL
ncbi:hypothetical protein PL8927_610019 [Planktothrix serta PCC 8927]|uniref:Uncharacterized protein n=1 Tax=Planktothrix serta PCC 8927 TaxID=671068 RepID=A0A7Z9BNK0_9CYAN|nr:hypothetical protein PL8927_610019 [Planktothrix serta PCC 8927]